MLDTKKNVFLICECTKLLKKKRYSWIISIKLEKLKETIFVAVGQFYNSW